MRKTTYYCDRCKQPINGMVFQLATLFGTAEDFEIRHDMTDGAELCEDCYKIVDDACASAIRNVTRVVSHSSTSKRRIEIDFPKVEALRDAGWTWKKIGEEFGVSDATIITRYREYIEEKEKTDGNDDTI